MASERALPFSLAAWLGAFAVALASRVALAGHDLSTREFLVWALIAGMPIAIGWLLQGGRSGDTIAQVLYNVEHPADSATTKSRDANRG